jgi:hypothetical protein
MSERPLVVTSPTHYGSPCRYPRAHENSVWLNASGRRVCGICHPPLHREPAHESREDGQEDAPAIFLTRADEVARSMRARWSIPALRDPQRAREART